MAYNADYLMFIEDQLKGVGDFYTKKMFGGVGFFIDGVMFGMIGGDAFRLKVDDSNRKDYEKYNMTAFLSTKMKKGLPYYEVPIDIIENKPTFHKWVQIAMAVAFKAKK